MSLPSPTFSTSKFTQPSSSGSYRIEMVFCPACRSSCRVTNAHVCHSPVLGSTSGSTSVSLTYSETDLGPENGFGPLA
jgi:hypothetical protein